MTNFNADPTTKYLSLKFYLPYEISNRNVQPDQNEKRRMVDQTIRHISGVDHFCEPLFELSQITNKEILTHLLS